MRSEEASTGANLPFLLLDVDGPLNPYAAKPNRRPTGYETHRMRPSGWRPHEARRPLRVWLNPDHGVALAALPYTLVWATTWGEEANEWISPHVGLPDLPCVPWSELHARRADGTYFKTHDVVRWAQGHPFAWVDDEISGADQEYVKQHHNGPALLHPVSPRTGLTEKDFEVLKTWAKMVSP